MDYRKARTRTLIQLGGLIEKAGLLESLELNLGDDLQQNPDCFEPVAILMGALQEIKAQLMLDTGNMQKILWSERGRAVLGRYR